MSTTLLCSLSKLSRWDYEKTGIRGTDSVILKSVVGDNADKLREFIFNYADSIYKNSVETVWDDHSFKEYIGYSKVLNTDYEEIRVTLSVSIIEVDIV